VKLGRSDVLVGAQVVLDGGEVHRLFNDLGVVRNAQRDGVDGLAEQPGGARVLEQVEDADAGPQGVIEPLVAVPAGDLLLRIILLINCILNLLIEFIIRTLVAACVGLGGCQRLGLVLRGK
jgi:hypothetical protein